NEESKLQLDRADSFERAHAWESIAEA
ncbi:MAG: hypothetical protein ACJAXA_002942, partial [Candidatus Aldehydirespiratoraceae bacterium]